MNTSDLKLAMQRRGLKTTSEEMAKLWNIRPQAVRAWKGRIPPLRVYQLKESHPHLIVQKRSRKA